MKRVECNWVEEGKLEEEGKKHPGKTCDEAHPNQDHDEWAAGKTPGGGCVSEDKEKEKENNAKEMCENLAIEDYTGDFDSELFLAVAGVRT